MLQITLTDKYNCELCEIQWTYHLFEKNKHKFYRQCFSVLVTGTLQSDGKIRAIKKAKFKSLKGAQEYYLDQRISKFYFL
jgi:hypothetical protein